MMALYLGITPECTDSLDKGIKFFFNYFSPTKELIFNLIFICSLILCKIFEIILPEGFAIKNYAPTFASPYRKDGK